jgi:hypothetical protein
MHHGAQRSHRADESQHGQTHHQEKTCPNIMEHGMVHNVLLLAVVFYLLGLPLPTPKNALSNGPTKTLREV